ncbi:hypothetical protein P7C73_g5343, partial [Tremellales sp. Uapishka_1]
MESSNEHSALDDSANTHPLDLLLNAISGSGAYDFPPTAHENPEGPGEAELSIDGLLAASRMIGKTGESSSRPQKRHFEASSPSPRQNKIAKTLTSHVVLSSQCTSGLPAGSVSKDGASTFSTVEVWHGKTGQKSYGKERRILNPPPIMRVGGPLFRQLTTATLSVVPAEATRIPPASLSSQTHYIPLNPRPPQLDTPPAPPSRRSHSRKEEREEAERKLKEAASRSGYGATLPSERRKMMDMGKERNALGEGVAFTGLWVGSEVGKEKEFRLELTLGQPGVEEKPHVASRPPAQSGQGPETTNEEQSIGEVLAHNGLEETFPSAMEEPSLDETSALVDHLHAATQTDPEALPPASFPSHGEPSTKPWATLVSTPLSVVSKPSQKTAKARSILSCLSDTATFGLWVRVNGQTVRTKYMAMESATSSNPARLTARTGKWSPFRMEVVHRAIPSEEASKPIRARHAAPVDEANAEILTYGSTIILIDVQSGIRSEMVKLVRIDKNEVVVGLDHGQPVSELQRVGFARLDSEGGEDLSSGGRWYLSAPGARVGGGEEKGVGSRSRPGQSKPRPPSAENPETLDEVEVQKVDKKKKWARKTKRNALALAAVAEEEQGSIQSALSWAQASRRDGMYSFFEGKGKEERTREATLESVDDWMCWVIGGVSSFSYSFFDGLAGFGTIPTSPIDPIPRLLAEPVIHQETNTLQLTLSDFPSPDHLYQSQPLEIYLGPIGPLAISTWKSTARRDAFAQNYQKAIPYASASSTSPSPEVYTNFPEHIEHVIVVVDLPDPIYIIQTMQQCVSQEPLVPPSHETSTPWLPVDQSDELTIQEALRNAESSDFTLNDFQPQHGMEDAFIDPALQSDSELFLPQTPPPDLATDLSTETHPPPMALHVPPSEVRKNDMVPLPLLLIRKSDGVGYGTGRNVVAERHVTANGGVEWQLRVVEPRHV